MKVFKIITILLLAGSLWASESPDAYLVTTPKHWHVVQQRPDMIRSVIVVKQMIPGGIRSVQFCIQENYDKELNYPITDTRMNIIETVTLQYQMTPQEIVRQLRRVGRVERMPSDLGVGAILDYILTGRSGEL